MNVNTTNSYSYGSSSSKGMSGLASNMDTDAMVKEMLSGTQSKIDAQEALKDQTEWRQEIYRDLIKQINSLQSGFFSSSSPTSLTNSSFFNAMSAATKSAILKANATSSASKGNTSIEVHQLASNHSMTSSSAVSGKLSGELDAIALQKLFDEQLSGDRKLVFEVKNKEGGSSKVSVDLKEFFVKDGEFVQNIDNDAIATAIQTALKDQGGLEAKVSMADGKLSIVSTDMDRWFNVSEESSELALNSLGLKVQDQGKTNNTNTQRALVSTLSLAPSLSFSMTLDESLKKTITVDLRNLQSTGDPTKIDIDKLKPELQKSIDQQHGTGVVEVAVSGGKLEFRSIVAGRKVMVGGDTEVLDALGLKNGQSNRIGMGGQLKDLFFQQPLQGERFRFEINGTKFSFAATDTIGDVIKAVNGSSAGVSITYKPLDDKFVMQVNDAGSGRTINMSQTEGNFLNALFGNGYGSLSTGSKAVSGQIGTGSIRGGTEYLDEVTKGSFSLVVDGTSYMLNVEAKSDKSAYTKAELLTELNKQLADQVGTFEASDGTRKNRVEINSDGTISVRDNAIVTFAGAGTSEPSEIERFAKAGDLVSALGFRTEKQSGNLATGDSTLAEAGLSDLANALGIRTSTKFSDLESLTAGMDVRFAFEEGRLVASSTSAQSFTYGTGEELERLFGVDTINLLARSRVGSSQIGTGSIRGGIEYLDGVTKGSFSLEVDGTSYTLKVAEKSDGSNYTKAELLTELNRQLADQVGTFEASDGTRKNRVEINSDGTISVRDNAIVTFAGAGTSDPSKIEQLAKDGDLVAVLGFRTEKKSGNLATGDSTLADVGLSALAVKLGIGTSTKLSELEGLTAGGDVRFSFEDGRLVASSTSNQSFTFGTEEDMKRLFGVGTINLSGASGQRSSIIDGQNAIVRIDGIFTERGSNLFSYNGINVELTDISETDGGAAMTGTVYQRGADGTLTPVALSTSGSWIDGGGFLRASDGSYLMADQTTTTTDRDQALHYQNLVYKDDEGNEINGVGISADGKLLDSTGKVLSARKTETITVSRDTDQIVDGVKGFITEYNKLLKKVNELLDEDADYRDYPPLTEEQRKGMSEKQIELWEEKAKVGLLRRDNTLDTFLQSMRSIWYETNSSGYALYSLGIETGKWDEKGQLVMSADGEAALRKAVENDPGGVMSFFTNEIDGAATRINDVITKVANTSSGSPGTLVQLAGIKGMSSEKNNTLYKKIEDIDDKIEVLKHQYSKEKERYWNQFNSMEQLIAQMNSQSSWLAQQFG